MQICKNNFIKLPFIFIAALFFSNFAFCVDNSLLEMPEMPSMPVISTDGSFYTPSLPMKMMPSVSENNKKNDSTDNTVITSSESTDDILSTLLNDDSTLTANDISNLSDYGLFSDINTLLGGGIGGLGATGGVSAVQNNSTNILLQEILKQLNELKQEQKNGSLQQQEAQENIKKDSENFKERNPSILRFKINNYDIKESLLDVFLSRPDEDGSFLLSADRRYVANGKTRTETFYILFQTIKEAGSRLSYNVTTTLDQDYENKNSFIYKMAKIPNLTAEKTGNLVVLKYEDDIKIDLLLDIDKR